MGITKVLLRFYYLSRHPFTKMAFWGPPPPPPPIQLNEISETPYTKMHFRDAQIQTNGIFEMPPKQKMTLSRTTYTKTAFSSPLYNKRAFSRPPIQKWHLRNSPKQQKQFSRSPYTKNDIFDHPHPP